MTLKEKRTKSNYFIWKHPVTYKVGDRVKAFIGSLGTISYVSPTCVVANWDSAGILKLHLDQGKSKFLDELVGNFSCDTL